MTEGARVSLDSLEAVLDFYEDRGRTAMFELAPAIAESLHGQVLDVFETEGFGQWPPLAESTLKKRRASSSPKMLQDTGNLVGSITPAWDDEAVEVFSNVPYAKYHVSPAPRRRIPLRDFFAIDTEAFENDVLDMVEIHVTRPIAAE